MPPPEKVGGGAAATASRTYERASEEIRQVDEIMRELDERRIAVGFSKAELARHVGKNPASIRRLFSSEANPELKTVAGMANALDLELALKPRKRSARVAATKKRRGGAAAGA